MKIFLFMNSLAVGKGGAEYISSSLANEMAKRGHDIYMGYYGPKAPAYSLSREVNLVSWDRAKDDIWKYKKRIIELNVDVLFFFYTNNLLKELYKLVHNTKIPFGMQECTNPERLIHNNWKSALIERSVWERELIASSATRLRMVMPGYEMSYPEYIRQNVRAFPNFALPPVGKKVNDKQRNRIVNIGGMKENKNLLPLLNAFVRLSADFKRWDLYIHGKAADYNRPYSKQIIDIIEDNNLKDRVFMTGPVDDISGEYLKSDIHVITSLSEGCPTCVLEAMAHQMPSIGIESCHGTKELIKHKRNGLLVDDDEQGVGLEQAMRELMSSSSKRNEMGVAAYEDSKNFTPKETYDLWEGLFEEMLEYKHDPSRRLKEQMEVDYERALHMERCRERVYRHDDECL